MTNAAGGGGSGGGGGAAVDQQQPIAAAVATSSSGGAVSNNNNINSNNNHTGVSSAGAIRALKKKKAQQAKLKELCRPVRREHTVKTLDAEWLKTLVDLAYWSDYTNSKRDAASAFATLSMNADNVSILDNAGVLGAVLSLLSVGDGMLYGDERDEHPGAEVIVSCVKDATLCLCNMLKREEIKTRFLKAPGGLQSVFRLTGSLCISLKRAGVTIIGHLCSDPRTMAEVVGEGAVRYLFGQLACDNERLKAHAIRLLQRIGRSPHVSPRLLMDVDVVQYMLVVLKGPHTAEEEDICLEHIGKICSDLDSCGKLVEFGVSRYLIAVLPQARVSLPHRLAMLKALEKMAGLGEAAERVLLDCGLMDSLVHVTFYEMAGYITSCQEYAATQMKVPRTPAAGGGGGDGNTAATAPANSNSRCNSLLVPGESSSSSAFPPILPSSRQGPEDYEDDWYGDGSTSNGGGGSGGDGDEDEPESLPVVSWNNPSKKRSTLYTEEKLSTALSIARTSLAVLTLFAQGGHSDSVLHAGVLAHLSTVPIGKHADPVIMRSVSQLVKYLADDSYLDDVKRYSFIAQGPLDLIQKCLFSDDMTQKTNAVKALAKACDYEELRSLIFTERILREVVIMGSIMQHETMEAAARVLLQACKSDGWRGTLVKSMNSLQLCLKMLASLMSEDAPLSSSSATAAGRQLETTLVIVLQAIVEMTNEASARSIVTGLGGVPLLTRCSRWSSNINTAAGGGGGGAGGTASDSSTSGGANQISNTGQRRHSHKSRKSLVQTNGGGVISNKAETMMTSAVAEKSTSTATFTALNGERGREGNKERAAGGGGGGDGSRGTQGKEQAIAAASSREGRRNNKQTTTEPTVEELQQQHLLRQQQQQSATIHEGIRTAASAALLNLGHVTEGGSAS